MTKPREPIFDPKKFAAMAEAKGLTEGQLGFRMFIFRKLLEHIALVVVETEGFATGIKFPTGDLLSSGTGLLISQETLDSVFGKDLGKSLSPNDGRFWAWTAFSEGVGALFTTSMALQLLTRLDVQPGNTLSFIANMIDRAFRSRVLLRVLEDTNWNLAHTSDRLRMGGAPAVIREIKKLGLQEQYDEARATAKVRRGGHRERTPDVAPSPKPVTPKPTAKLASKRK